MSVWNRWSTYVLPTNNKDWIYIITYQNNKRSSKYTNTKHDINPSNYCQPQSSIWDEACTQYDHSKTQNIKEGKKFSGVDLQKPKGIWILLVSFALNVYTSDEIIRSINISKGRNNDFN